MTLSNSSDAACKPLNDELGIYHEQIIYLQDRTAQNPDNINYYLEEADVYLKLNDYEKANTLYKKALDLATVEFVKQYLKGAILYTEGKPEKAAEILDKMLEETPQSKRAQHLRGLVALQMNDNNLALQHFNKAVDIDNNYIDALNQIGWYYVGQADYDKAIKYFNQVLYRDDYNVIAMDGKGYSLYKIGLNKEATPYLNEVIILQPQNWGAWVARGDIYFSEGNYNLAKYCLQQAECINAEALEVRLLKQKLQPLPKPCVIKNEELKDDSSETQSLDQKEKEPAGS
jgi:tetratricopeptide (TPR) repeat protein